MWKEANNWNIHFLLSLRYNLRMRYTNHTGPTKYMWTWKMEWMNTWIITFWSITNFIYVPCVQIMQYIHPSMEYIYAFMRKKSTATMSRKKKEKILDNLIRFFSFSFLWTSLSNLHLVENNKKKIKEDRLITQFTYIHYSYC